MKWIKYNVLQNTINVGTVSKPVYEDVLLEKKVLYSEENLIIAKEEAYEGKYTIEDDAEIKVDIHTSLTFPSYLALVGNINEDMVNAALGKNNEDNISGVGKALAMYARFVKPSVVIADEFPNLIASSTLNDVNEEAIVEILNNATLNSLASSNDYMYEKTLLNKAKNVIYDERLSYDDTPPIEFPNVNIELFSDNAQVALHRSSEGGSYLFKSTETFKINGAKFLNVYLNSYDLGSGESVDIGILNSSGTDLIKFIHAERNSEVYRVRFSIDISDLNLEEAAIGIKAYNMRSGRYFRLYSIILSNYDMKELKV